MAEGNTENKPPVKLQIDRPQDFKFHLAYEVYSNAWDENASDEARSKLNELISTLANNEDGFSDFYAQMQRYRGDTGSFRSGRVRIETSRKRSWQREESKAGRNRRHR